MHITDICNHKVIDIAAMALVREAVQTMREHHVGALIVIDQLDDERTPIGIVTDRDIVLSVVATGIDPLLVTFGDVMSSPPATCSENDELSDAIATMRERGVRGLPVLNAKGDLARMLAADDVSSALASQLACLSRAVTSEQIHEMQKRR